MKKITMLLLLAVTSLLAFSQDENNGEYHIKTIFSKNKGNGGYGAFTMGYTRIDGKDAIITGAQAAYIVDHSLAIGFAGYGFANDFDYNEIGNDSPLDFGLAGGYGGLFVEPIIASRLPAHLCFPVLFGIGGVAKVENSDWWENNYNNHNPESDVYLVFEPAVELELNLTRFARMAAFASYRLTSDIELDGIDKDVLKGWNFGLTFKVGKF